MGILDTIINTQQKQSLEELELGFIINKILEPLKEREKLILSKRYGLQGQNMQTLKTVGEEQGLTRERVRQIEKDLLKNLRRGVQELDAFVAARDLLVNTVSEHGGIMAESALLDHLGVEEDQEVNAVKFILSLINELEEHKADSDVKSAWAHLSFNKQTLKEFLTAARKVLESHGKPLEPQEFLEKIKSEDFYTKNSANLNDQIILNFLAAAIPIHRNSFGEYGLHDWSEIKPRDVGDKAYLVMKHHGKPEHYSTITELINKHGTDKRTAYKETVHNKLIKDKRFVLVGRGIYALAEWGYKPGVVSDIIREVLVEAKRPLSREEIIDAVMKKRMVKKNTILVGLSNKKLFKKIGKNLYDLSETK